MVASVFCTTSVQFLRPFVSALNDNNPRFLFFLFFNFFLYSLYMMYVRLTLMYFSLVFLFGESRKVKLKQHGSEN